MCGIFGFILNEPLQDKEIAEGLSHTKSLSHRGPDHIGSWFNKEEGIFLGHTRLSIIDLTSDSHQPFSNENSHLVFNGEIYNYRELKKSLISKGLIFRTEGDTEVLSNYLKEYGGNRLEEIDGMFAFAYYKDKSLILATDVFGEKPLYWYQNEKGFYFSSEPAPLISLLSLKINPNETLIKEFNTLGYLSAGKTFYEGLVSCEPGSFLEVKQNQKVNKGVYWKKPEFFEEKGRIHPLEESEIDEIHSLIIESLRNRIYSDVPMGLFLSSGIDSSLIGCLLKKDLNLDVLSLTVSFDKGLVHDESDKAKRISEFLDLKHIIVDSESKDSYSSLHNLTSIYGEPNDNSTAISVRQMSKIAKNYFTVAFSGTGGDELFFGYGKHNFLYKNNYFLSSTSLKSFLNIFRSNQFKSFRKIQTAIFLSQYKELDLVFALKNSPYFSDRELADEFILSSEILDQEHGSIIRKYINFDLNQNLPYSIIPAIERSSMREGLEVRTPFLNKALIEHLSSIDIRRLLQGGQKHILRKILSRYLPENLIDRGKRGFVFPIQKLIKENKDSLDKLSKKDPTVNYIDSISNETPEINKLMLRKLILENFSEASG